MSDKPNTNIKTELEARADDELLKSIAEDLKKEDPTLKESDSIAEIIEASISTTTLNVMFGGDIDFKNPKAQKDND